MAGEKDMYEFKNSKELLEYIATCKEQIIVLKKRLSVLSSQKDKDVLRKKIDLNDKIRCLKKNINQCYKYMKRATCIKSEYLMQVIYEYLTAIYKDEYVFDDYFTITMHLNFAQPWLLGCFRYRIIVTKENYDKIMHAKRTGLRYLYDDPILEKCLEPCIDKKYICLYHLDSKPLLVNGELEKNFSSFPCLKNLAYRFIDLDLAYPKMSDKDKCDFICSVIKKKKSEKQKMLKK